MKKKDILFLCQFFYPEYISSATLPYDTAAALADAGFSVDALCGYPHEYTKEQSQPVTETVNGIHIRRVKYVQRDRKGFLDRLVNYFSLTFMMLLHLPQMAKYRSIIVYSNPPILPWVASWAKLLFGCKLIFVAYDLYPEVAVRTNTLREGSIICRMMDHINRCVFRRADAAVALSTEMKEFIVKNRPIDEARVHVIPNWFRDEGAMDRDNTRNPFAQAAGDRFVVSYFGNMGTAQDMQTILDAVTALKDDPRVFFLFAGHGNKFASVKEAAERSGMTNIQIHEFLHGEDFRNALRASSCALVCLEKGLTGLCVPSKTYSYMMQGIPLLAIMDEGDIVSDIQAGAGAWVRNGQSQALADTIVKLCENPEAVQEMSRKCRSIFLENYTTQISTAKYVELFRQMLGTGR